MSENNNINSTEEQKYVTNINNDMNSTEEQRYVTHSGKTNSGSSMDSWISLALFCCCCLCFLILMIVSFTHNVNRVSRDIAFTAAVVNSANESGKD